MSGKRYYWLKLQDGFFTSKRIKKLRKLAGGDTFTIIYLKMQLLAMKTDGYLKWTGLEEDFAAELALDLDEEEDNVKITLSYLQNCGLIETSDGVSFYLPYAVENTGSEGSSAKRMRDLRNRQASLCDTAVTPALRLSDGEKEIEKEIEKDIEIEREYKADKPPRAPRFTPPTLEEVKAYCEERDNGVDPQRFIDYYETRGWMLGKTKMKDWRAAVRTWERGSGKKSDKDGFYRDSVSDDELEEFMRG